MAAERVGEAEQAGVKETTAPRGKQQVYSALRTPHSAPELPAALAADLDGNFERLVLTYQGRLYAFALRLTCSPQDAEEVAQDAFVRAYRALCGYTSERIRGLALKPWLYQIALNVARNRVRGRRLAVVPLDGPDGRPRVEPPDDERRRPEALLESAERRDDLGALVAALPERYRAAVVLRHVEGLGYAELAATLDQPVGTVKANVHRGVRLLREALTRAGDGQGNREG
jgi:RNA polymerase sigma-70 factor (ECF subfamily)